MKRKFISSIILTLVLIAGCGTQKAESATETLETSSSEVVETAAETEEQTESTIEIPNLVTQEQLQEIADTVDMDSVAEQLYMIYSEIGAEDLLTAGIEYADYDKSLDILTFEMIFIVDGKPEMEAGILSVDGDSRVAWLSNYNNGHRYWVNEKSRPVTDIYDYATDELKTPAETEFDLEEFERQSEEESKRIREEYEKEREKIFEEYGVEP